MDPDCRFYLCTVCFKTSETEMLCHGHPMVRCDGFEPGDVDLKPLMDGEGDLLTRAPRWYLEKLKLVGNG